MMKKKWMAWLLSFALALGLLPAEASAAGRPASSDYWIDMSAQDARQMLRAVYEGTETRRMVFVYYGTDASSQTAAAQFAGNAASAKYYVYNYYTGDGESLLDDLAPLLNGNTSPTLPVAVTYNPAREGYVAKDHVSTLTNPGGAIEGVNGLLDMMRESGIQNGGSTPPSPSSGGDTENGPDYSGSGGCSIPGVGDYEWEVLRLVNQYRMTGGVQPLSVFEELQAAAELRASELVRYLSHTRPDGSGYETAFSGVAWYTHAENIASGQTSPADVMYSWLHSSGHRANIERANKLHLGVGCYYDGNDDGYGYRRYWAQNFLSARGCVLYDMSLSRTAVPGGGYTDLEKLLTAADVEVTMQCPVHGKCSMPLIAGMCTGYDPNAAGDQEITVTYEDYQGVRLTALLTITTDEIDEVDEIDKKHVHNWTVTAQTEASCTEDSTAEYTCSCGETRIETNGSARGHAFAWDEGTGTYSCQTCGVGISAALEDAYSELRDQADQEMCWSISGGANDDPDGIRAFLAEKIADILERNGAQAYSFEIQPLDRAVDVYRYRVVFLTPPEEGPAEPEAPDSAAPRGGVEPEAALVTEILTLKLHGLAAADSDSEGPEDPEPPDIVSYTVSVRAVPAAGGSATGGGRFDENAAATVSAAANPGYRFIRWSENGREVSAAASYTFAVTADRALVAEFAAAGDLGAPDSPGSAPGGSSAPTVYPPIVKQPAQGGSISVTPSRPGAGDKVTITPKPDAGYEVGQISVTDDRGSSVAVTAEPDGTYTFVQPSGRVTIEAVYKPVELPAETPVETPWRNPFRDVSESGWYYEAVRFVSVNGLMNGSGGLFGPDDDLSRAQLAQILYNMAGRPAVSGGSVFRDVASDQWYASAIAWAAANGIASGYGGGLFGPNDSITREQLAVMLWQYSGRPAAADRELRFIDADKISGYALDALCWAAEKGILTGYSSGELVPQGLATRAQAAQMLKNFMETR